MVGVLIFSVLFLKPSSAFADIPAVVLDPSLPVTTCGEMLAPGTYTLTADITTSASSTCFLVSSDSVIIDGGGHTVTSSGSSTLNNLNLINIHNNSNPVDVSNFVVYDGGGNSGFIFNVKAPVGSGSLGGTIYIPVAPSSSSYVPRTWTSNNNGNNNNGNNNNNNAGNGNTGGGGGGGGSGGSLYSINPGNLGDLNLSSLSKLDLGLGNNLGTSKFVNPLADLKNLKKLDDLKKINPMSIKENLGNFANSQEFPKPLVNLVKTVPVIQKQLDAAGITNGYELYSLKQSPILTPTISQLQKENIARPNNLIFTAVDGESVPTRLSIDNQGNLYQVINVEPYSKIDVSVKDTSKTIKVSFDKKAVKATKDSKAVVTSSFRAPGDAGEYKLTIGTNTLIVRIGLLTQDIVVGDSTVITASDTSSGAPNLPLKLSPIQKAWSFFTSGNSSKNTSAKKAVNDNSKVQSNTSTTDKAGATKAPSQTSKLSPIQKAWSWFTK